MRNVKAYLNKRYDLKTNYSNSYDHRKEKSIRSVHIPCVDLSEIYAVVHHYCVGNMLYEELRLSNKLLYRLVNLI